jgi:LPXTG-motif cell wall-anchored protein
VTVPVPLVPPAVTPLPATGTDTNSIVLRAGILVLLGAGLVGAAMVRRRSGTAA